MKEEKANLRLGPGTHFSKSWEVFKYMPLHPIEEKKGWIKTKDVDGEVHWVFSGLTTKKYRCAVVKVSKANLRVGPGVQFKVVEELSPISKYSCFQVILEEKGWVKVKDIYNDTYWISKKLVWIN